MKLNTRIMLESVIVSVFLMIVFFIWRMIQGFVNTRNVQSFYGTDVSDTEHFPAEVAFGTTYSFGWPGLVAGFLLFAFIYYGVRIVISRTGK